MSNLRRDARCLIRQREPIHCWQLFSPTRFNELHKVARHASRRSFRFLSKPVAPVFAKRNHYNRPAKIHKKLERFPTLRVRFVPLYGIILTSVASHVAYHPSNRARCFGRKFTLWLQTILNIHQPLLSIPLLNNVDTCWLDFGYQPSCYWRSLPEV